VCDAAAPDVRIVNLETSITRSGEFAAFNLFGPRAEAAWLCHVLDRESRKFGTRTALTHSGVLKVSEGQKSD
jgi:hypothetical protein